MSSGSRFITQEQEPVQANGVGVARRRPTIAVVAGEVVLARSAAAFDLEILGGGPGVVRRFGRLAVVDLLALAAPQSPPLLIGVAVAHVAVLI